ncbi:MAG: DMT family transporter [Rhodothermaceae bacterium]|nr:DMT family transporter [Rhodothermaceae bacterium]
MLRSDRRYDAALLLVVLIWGLNFPIIKVPLAVMPPFTVNLFRFLVSIAVLGALWAAEARRQGRAFAGAFRKQPWTIGGLGLIGHVGYQVFFILGVANTTAGSAALIIASAPIWTALIGHLSGVDRLHSAQWAGVLLSFVGVLTVVLAGEGQVDFSSDAFVGNMLMLAGAVMWALYTVLSRPVMARGADPLAFTFFGVLVAMPILIALGLFTLPATDWAAVDGWTWLALLFSGGLSTGLAYYLWNVAVRRVGPSQTAVFSNLVPFVALLAALVVLGEPITWAQVFGGVLIIGGLVVMRRGRQLVPA